MGIARTPEIRTMPAPDIDVVKTYLLGLQDRICAALETEDGKEKFRDDAWVRP
jgi:coproporphyrinogen III oxidase